VIGLELAERDEVVEKTPACPGEVAIAHECGFTARGHHRITVAQERVTQVARIVIRLSQSAANPEWNVAPERAPQRRPMHVPPKRDADARL
jgi:hypothetical protein